MNSKGRGVIVEKDTLLAEARQRRRFYTKQASDFVSTRIQASDFTSDYFPSKKSRTVIVHSKGIIDNTAAA